jgi:hypothetical protein
MIVLSDVGALYALASRPLARFVPRDFTIAGEQDKSRFPPNLFLFVNDVLHRVKWFWVTK